MKKLLPALFLILIAGLPFAKDKINRVFAQDCSFTFRVVDQQGNPLSGAFVRIRLNLTTGEWREIAYCNTGADGTCTKSLSCAAPCGIDATAEYGSKQAHSQGFYQCGTTILLIVFLDEPTPTPTPPPAATPTPTPGSSGTPAPPPGVCTFDIKVVNHFGSPIPEKTVTSSSGSSCSTQDPDGSCQIDFGSSGTYTLSAPGCPEQTVNIDCSFSAQATNQPDSLFTVNYVCDQGSPGSPDESDPPDDAPEAECQQSGDTTCAGGDCMSRWEVRTSWPDDCGCDPVCNTTSLQTSHCAQSFYVRSSVTMKRNECTNPCNGSYWAQKDWGGTIQISFDDTKVPFAGKKKEGTDSEIHEDEIKYLADYFEGTNDYNRDYLFDKINLGPFFPISRKYHGTTTTLITNYEGVIRKLTPYEYQNQLKKSLISRTLNVCTAKPPPEAIHDYQLQYIGRLCWHAPFLVQVAEALANKLGLTPDNTWRALNFCLYSVNAYDTLELIEPMHALIHELENRFSITIDHFREDSVPGAIEKGIYLSDLQGHLPPSVNNFTSAEEYQEAWDIWKKAEGGKWWKLWQVTPMVTREDTRGRVTGVAELRPWPTEYWPSAGQNTVAREVRFPHLARLWETSGWLQQILIPESEELETTSDQESIFSGGGIKTLSDSEPPTDSLSSFRVLSPADNPQIRAISTKVTGIDSDSSGCGISNSSATSVLGEKIRLAQAAGCFHLEASASYSEPNVNVTISFVSDGGDGDIWLNKNGQLCAHNQWNAGVNPVFSIPPQYTCSPIVVNRGQCVTATWEGSASNCPGGMGYATVSCTFCVDAAGVMTSNCDTSTLPPTPPDACNLPPVPFSDECVESAITDSNPNDNVCFNSNIAGTLSAVDEIENPYCEKGNGDAGCQCKNVSDGDCSDPANLFDRCVRFCCKEDNYGVFRQVEVKTRIPYLTELYEHSTPADQGFFNIFRPGKEAPFDDMAAKSVLNYSFSGGTADPPVGDFYYPYLGGVQITKEWVIKALTPYIE